MKIKIALIRHGEVEKGFDGPLCEHSKKIIRAKREAGAYPALRHVYSCENFCCRETANLIYTLPVVILKKPGTSESADSGGQMQQLLQNKILGDWVNSQQSKDFSNIEAFYGAEAKARSIIRSVGAEMAKKRAEQCALILSKLIILEILRLYCVPRSSYEDWEISFGGGYLIEYDTVEETARILEKI